MSPKPCTAERAEIEYARQIKRFRMLKILHGMTEEDKEKQVRDWEEKYQVHG